MDSETCAITAAVSEEKGGKTHKWFTVEQANTQGSANFVCPLGGKVYEMRDLRGAPS